MKKIKASCSPFMELLLKKGVDSLTQEEQEKALLLLENEYRADLSNVEVIHLLLRLYNKLKMFSSAKEIGTDFLKANGYEKKILAELSVSYLHTDEMSRYFSLVSQFAPPVIKKKEKKQNSTLPSFHSSPFINNIGEFACWKATDQFRFLKQIQFEEIGLYLNFFLPVLRHPNCGALVKSLIFEMMQKQKIDQIVPVHKLGLKGEFNPKCVHPIGEGAFSNALLTEVRQRLESENPSLLDELKETIQHHLFTLYPFQLEPLEVSFWCQAYLLWVSKLYGYTLVQPAISVIKKLEKAVLFIERIEADAQNYFI